MSAILPLFALAASLSDQPRLDVARVQDVVAAVQSCSRAVMGKAKVDHGALEAEGWKQDALQGIGVVRRKPGNAAIILANNGQSSSFPGNFMQEVCFVRAQLSSSDVPGTLADQITRLIKVQPIIIRNNRDQWLWSGPSVWVSQEPFDPDANGLPATQLGVMPAFQGWPRPTPDASSQNQNQEPR
ncbi:hypothetical protein V6R86_05890 [Sphingomonas kaistensis]|uniref:Uncharacterized protein n=1 Tax=Sphingomonas kaistensis TaxID=298708 RepID=A0ABZ2G266_9SPHN